jgi:hypothetical protein
MLKIVDGIPLIGKSTGAYRVRAVDLGHGHVEVVTSRVIEWQEAEWSDQVMADHLQVVADFERDNPEEIEERDRKRSARRAKTRVRRQCKAMGADTLLTLTYRALVTDLGLCKADLKEFARRVYRVLPGFRGIAIFEPQDRGAWHVHIATAGIPTLLPSKSGDFRSYNVLRAIWRSVTKEREGNVDVQRRRRHCRKSAAQIAAYLSKYMGKAFMEWGDKGRNRSTTFGAVTVPDMVELGIAATLPGALDMAFALLEDRHTVARMSLDPFRDWFFLAAEKLPDRLMKVTH